MSDINEVNYYIMNDKFEIIAPLDDYESLIWTDRYSDAGDFEIYTGITTQSQEFLKMNYYLKSLFSDHVMILSSNEISSDIESGTVLIIKGESLESILKRRIVWKQTTLDGNFQEELERLLNENIISPSDESRKIENFIFVKSEDEQITSLKVQAQFTGDTIFDVVKSLCDKFKIGFKITLNDKKQFAFMLYRGVNRTYGQKQNPYVIISKTYDNIVSSDYLVSNDTLKNVALVAGEGEGLDRKTFVTGNEVISGLNRRELYVDARDISSNLSNGEVLPLDQYNILLKQRGDEKLADNRITKSFDGQIDPLGQFKYQQDYFIGDIIQFEDGYGNSAHARISEYIYSYSNEGNETYPTLEIMGDTVTYYVDIGDVHTEELNAGETVLSPKTFVPKKTSWEFLGWRQDSIADGVVETVLIMEYDPITLYAVFRQPVVLTYYNSTVYTAINYNYYNNGNIANAKFTLVPAEISGWEFRGWGTSSAGNASVEYPEIKDTEFSSDTTVYALYQQTITLSYNSNGGSGSVNSSSGLRYYNSLGTYTNPTFTLAQNTFSRNNYSFVQWRMGSVNGTAYVPGAKVALQSNTVFYAEWKSLGHIVTYVYNGQTATKTVAVGATVLSPGLNPSLAGCSFLGWTNNQNSAIPLKTLNMGDNDITLWAVWKAANKNITAHGNNTYKEKEYVGYNTPFDSLAFDETVDTTLYSGIFINFSRILQSVNLMRGQNYSLQLYVTDGTVGTISSIFRWWFPTDGVYPFDCWSGYGLKYVTNNLTGFEMTNQSFTLNFNTNNTTSARIYWRIAVNEGSMGEQAYRTSVFTNLNQCHLVGRQFVK